MESENDMQPNIKKEEGEGFSDILNEARQIKAHTLKTFQLVKW